MSILKTQLLFPAILFAIISCTLPGNKIPTLEESHVVPAAKEATGAPEITGYYRNSKSTDAFIQISFSVSMKQTETENAVLVSPHANFTYTWNTDSTTLLLRPVTKLQAATDYLVEVTTDAVSSVDLHLQKNDTYSFTTLWDFSEQSIVSGSSTSAYTPSIAWSGLEYGICWEDNKDGNPEIYFARVDINGAIIDSPLRVTNSAASSEVCPTIIWNGSEYAITWFDDTPLARKIYFVRINAAGSKIGSEIAVSNSTNDCITPVLSWDNINSQYCILWADYRHGMGKEFYGALVDAAGTKIGNDIRITNTSGDSSFPDIVWNGTEYAITWMDTIDNSRYFDIYFTTVSSSLVPSNKITRVSSKDNRTSERPSLTWSGSEYGICWEEYSCIMFSRLDNTGIVDNSTMNISNSRYGAAYADVTWTGNKFIILWSETRYRYNGYDVYAVELDPVSNTLDKEERVSDFQEINSVSNVVFNGNDVAAVWQKYVSRSWGKVYLAF